MEKLNALERSAKYNADNFESVTVAGTKEILAIAEAFRAIERRAEAADRYAESLNALLDSRDATLSRYEAKLAELEKQEPYGYVHKSIYEICGSCSISNDHDAYRNSSSHIPLFTRPAPAINLAELVPGNYFGELVLKARASADKAMIKFPQPNYVLLKVAEEAGEVVQAGVHYAENRMTWQEVEGEIVQLLAMLIRLVTEGDQVNGITPPEACRADILRNIEEAK